MASLVRLARIVGPYIAILQIHADMIDDWSLEGARRLTYLAKKFAFIIWEGGRILNTQQCSSNRSLSSEEITKEIDMARKRYTKGAVGVADWAGLASTWIIGPEEDGNGASRLIPTLRRAARETLAYRTNSVRTEISGGEHGSIAANLHGDGDEEEENGADDNYLLLPNDIDDGTGLSNPLRKASVISLTRTITQRTEPSTPSSTGVDDSPFSELEEEPEDYDRPTPPIPALPEPPLLSRGVVLCLPQDDDTRFTPQYKAAALSTAKSHDEFVVGFTSDEPWIHACHRQPPRCAPNPAECGHSNSDDDSQSDDDNNHVYDEPQTLLMFNPLESDHLRRVNAANQHLGTTDDATQGLRTLDLDPVASPSSSRLPQQVVALQQLIDRAVLVRDSLIPAPTTGAPNGGQGQDCYDIILVPVISMDA
ncbi:hypothetical protein FQN57_000095 [Myotisia sp. PD_48]|nr:hypothetical protein FQN57_000095 [Myotisia sp. PD_48]